MWQSGGPSHAKSNLTNSSASPRPVSVSSTSLRDSSSEAGVDENESHLQQLASTAAATASNTLSALRNTSVTGMATLLFGERSEKVHIDTVRESNKQADRLKGLVVVFLGGTGGIGASTARELFKRATSPKAYIIGRDRTKGTELTQELERSNSGGEAIFIRKDISLLSAVDELCEDLKSREKKINCLVLTTGFMSVKGRVETAEGLDKKMSVNYYSRIRATINLMPLLTAAADKGELSRVISVLGAGSEGDVRLDDLDLRRNFTLHACLAHCVVMTDFMVEELAKRYPATSFSHSYPGAVKSGIANELSGPMRLAVKVLYAVMTPWILNVNESGERHFFQIISKRYPAAKGAAGIDVPQSSEVMRGTDGKRGSGAYLIDEDGGRTGDDRILAKYRAQNIGVIVWEHTMHMFKQAEIKNLTHSSKRAAEGSPEGEGRGAPHPPVENPIGWRPG